MTNIPTHKPALEEATDIIGSIEQIPQTIKAMAEDYAKKMMRLLTFVPIVFVACKPYGELPLDLANGYCGSAIGAEKPKNFQWEGGDEEMSLNLSQLGEKTICVDGAGEWRYQYKLVGQVLGEKKWHDGFTFCPTFDEKDVRHFVTDEGIDVTEINTKTTFDFKGKEYDFKLDFILERPSPDGADMRVSTSSNRFKGDIVIEGFELPGETQEAFEEGELLELCGDQALRGMDL